MRKEKNEAFALRKSGKTYTDISSRLHIPKSTLSAWFHDTEWSRRITEINNSVSICRSTRRIIDLNKTRGAKLQQIYAQAVNEAAEEYAHLRKIPLFLLGIGLYWGEGSKTGNSVKLGNVDPAMLHIFRLFLIDICGVDPERITAHVVTYPDLSIDACEEYWAFHTGIARSKFFRTTVIAGKHASRKVTHGVCTIAAHSAFLKRKMDVWTQLLSQDMMTT